MEIPVTTLFVKISEREFLKLPPIFTRSFRIPNKACEDEEKKSAEDEKKEKDEDDDRARKLATPRHGKYAVCLP